MNATICQPQYSHLAGMREFYLTQNAYPTSINGDILLVRSHIAYWSGMDAAEYAIIKKSRGDSYRVYRSQHGQRIKDFVTVRIVDAYDHREGVTGWK